MVPARVGQALPALWRAGSSGHGMQVRLGVVASGLVLAAPAGSAVSRQSASVSGTRPRVDPASLAAREQESCTVAMTVTGEGWVRDARLRQSIGFQRLDQACLDAVSGVHVPKKWLLNK